MDVQRNALLLFCKPSVPGLVKTRLTQKRGGSLTQEEAAEFFKCSALDVADLAFLCLDDLKEMNERERTEDPDAPLRFYDVFLSTISTEAIEMIQDIIEADGLEGNITFICDSGSSFDEHFDSAFIQIFKQGYDSVVAVGCDMPTMSRRQLIEAFTTLDYLAQTNERRWAFVQAPCQDSGVSIIGLTRTTPIDSTGVYYNLNGRPVLDAYVEKIRELEIPCGYLGSVADVDTEHDLAHTLSCLEAIAEASQYQPGLYLARRVLAWAYTHGLRVVSEPDDGFDPRDDIDTPHSSKANVSRV